jgi:hypothetical protein
MIVDDLFESLSNVGVGDPVIITGNVEFRGKTGDVREIGRDGTFVVVDLYNYGPKSFQASDVEYNNYADAQDEQDSLKEHRMRITELNKPTQIDESLLLEDPVYRSFKQVGQKLMEANLTTQQINQIFQQIQQNATAAGDNRTMIGKGKDTASAVNKAWEDLKTKMQNSGPVQGFDQKVSDVLSKIGAGSADPQFNGEVNKWVQKYRDFAKKYPVAQGAIYAALIAVAGISGVGIGGAAALGLLKMADNLLKGERFTSAAYSGAKTGALAYGAGQLGQAIKGQPAAGGDAAVQSATNTSDVASQAGAAASQSLRKEVEAIALKAAEDAIAGGADPNSVNTIAGTVQGAIDQFGSAAGGKLSQMSIDGIARKAAMVAAKNAGGMNESRKLSESQIYLVIGNIVDRQRKLDEGVMDTIKGAAGKAADYIKTKGTNLTTKVTADKLLQAWKKAKSPTDSLDVAKVIQNAGVPSATIKQVYNSMQIPFAGEPGAQPTMSRNIPVNKPVPTPAGAAPAGSAAAGAVGAMTKSLQQPEKSSTGGTTAQTATGLKHTASAQNPNATPAQPTAAAAGTKPGAQPASYNAANVMKLPGMEKYAKASPAVAPRAANFAGPSGYGQTTMGFKAPGAARTPAVAPAVPKTSRATAQGGAPTKTPTQAEKDAYVRSIGAPAMAEADQEKVGNMDADQFDAAMARLKRLAGTGPLKTVYDPAKRVYRNVPTAVQPTTQPKK